MEITRTNTVTLPQIAKAISESSDCDQALFFKLLADEFDSWTLANREMQLLFIVDKLEPSAVKLIEDLHAWIKHNREGCNDG